MIGIDRIRSLLREPDYRRVWGSGVASGSCRWLEILAAGVYAFENNIERLAEDHDNAKRLAHGLMQIPGIEVDPEEPETNMVFFDVNGLGMDNFEMAERLLKKGVRIGAGYGPRDLMRAVTHLDVDAAGIDRALEAVRDVAAGRD